MQVIPSALHTDGELVKLVRLNYWTDRWPDAFHVRLVRWISSEIVCECEQFAGGLFSKLEAQWKAVNIPPPKPSNTVFRCVLFLL